MGNGRGTAVVFGLWCALAGCREPAQRPAGRDAGRDAPVIGDAGRDAPVISDAGRDVPVISDAGRDAPVIRDAAPAPVDAPSSDAGGVERPAPRDASTADLPADGFPADARRICPRPVAATDCDPPGGGCQRTWADVLSTPPFCDPMHRPGTFFIEETRATCGPYRVVTVNESEWMSQYFYDAVNGQLIAIYGGGLPEIAPFGCEAGPPGGIPDCSGTDTVDHPCRGDAG